MLACIPVLPTGSAVWQVSGTAAVPAAAANYGISPRGSHGETPWSVQLNLNVAYEPKWANGLTFQADIINVLNRQVAGAYNSRYETSTRNQPNQFYNQEIQVSAPRYLRLMARYDF